MENKIEIPPFYVGQEVVANCTFFDLIQGKTYVVSKISQCTCGAWDVEIGLPLPDYFSRSVCLDCGAEDTTNAYRASRFSPKIEIPAFISMSEVVKLETVGAN